VGNYDSILFELHYTGVIVNYDYVCDINVCETDVFAYALILIISTECVENYRNRKASKFIISSPNYTLQS